MILKEFLKDFYGHAQKIKESYVSVEGIFEE